MAVTSDNGPGTVMDWRAAAVAETIAAIRGIESELGVTPAALDKIRERLIALASRSELFPEASFPIPAGARNRHRPPRMPTTASRSTPRRGLQDAPRRRTTTRPGRSTPESTARSTTSSIGAPTTARRRARGGSNAPTS